MTTKRLIILIFLLTSCLFGFSQNKWTLVTIDSFGKKKAGIISETGQLIVPVEFEAVVGSNGIFF